MLTFSVNTNANNEGYILKVKKAIDDNIMYFKKFNGIHWEEAVQRTFITAVANQNEDYENIEPYIKNLARNILKVQELERPYDTVTEDGEVSYPYMKLTSFIDEDIFIDNKEVEDTLKEMYLLYKEDFHKLELLFKEGVEDNYKLTRGEVIKNPELKASIEMLCFKYGTQEIFHRLYKFLSKLPDYLRPIENTSMKIIEMKQRNPRTLDQVPDLPMIQDECGRYLGIDKNTLTMETDPDFIKWDTIAKTTSDIIKIDITPLMDYMYQQVFVPQGVQTKHITWCGDIYKMTTPAGKEVVNLDRNKFLNMVRIELIENLIDSRFNTIIAVSPDSVYLKPTRVVVYDTIRLVLVSGKPMDLPLTVHIKKRH